MKRFAPTAVLLAALLSALPSARAQDIVSSGGELLDVPPCRPGAQEVRSLVAAGVLLGFPATPSELARNAVRQVFEGLRCGDVAWTTRFLAEVPQGYAVGIPRLGEPLRGGFELTTATTALSGTSAVVSWRLRLPGNGQAWSGTARLEPDAQSGWRVLFSSLTDDGLPFFPTAAR